MEVPGAPDRGENSDDETPALHAASDDADDDADEVHGSGSGNEEGDARGVPLVQKDEAEVMNQRADRWRYPVRQGRLAVDYWLQLYMV